MKSNILCAAVLAACSCGSALAMAPSTVDFSHGLEGWYGVGVASQVTSGIDSQLGNGTPAFHAVAGGSEFTLKNDTNPSFVGNYTASKGFTFSLDVTVAELAIGGPGGFPLAQELVLELRDYDKPSPEQAYSSVWVSLGVIGDGRPATQHLSVTVGDSSSNTLPSGWHGFGEMTPDGQLQLPYAQTFRRILTDVDSIVISTAVPGYIYGAEQYYNLSVDNISISAVPEPESWAMLLGGLGLLSWRARRRSK